MNMTTKAKIDELGPWFHNLHLPDGNHTAPEHFLGDFPKFKWQQIEPHIPKDLTGKRALDIGCNAGFYSFELAGRGADVTAIDLDDHYLNQARWAQSLMPSQGKVTFKKQAVYELADDDQQYDIVWFMGVLYHLRYPLLALDIIRRRCRGTMVFQTMTMPGDKVVEVKDNYPLDKREVMLQDGWPQMAFIEKRFADDPTNWWAANHAGVLALLRAAGFTNIKRIAHEIYVCEADGESDSNNPDYDALRKNQANSTL
ncbi:TIGR04290 family methyltransferase [Alteromonas pelagimontana]|uniref:TIGR04290 family methyltransferase n=1 Tax=Alteromonas pelagimontana TaxID=1858656 RepID=A0A6M4MBM8_9ALTE|nr:TIGR04290 family methyltransferase [Alteromonas pelagimontana]QJR80591.1 TIGR04290 family methyltransferase [Alteromonas pelagimontana]